MRQNRPNISLFDTFVNVNTPLVSFCIQWFAGKLTIANVRI